jgi:hypothetical protein
MDPYIRVIVKPLYINAADMYTSSYGDGVYATGTPLVEAAADRITRRRAMYEEAQQTGYIDWWHTRNNRSCTVEELLSEVG